jgi:hypothetical protein
MRPVLSHFTVLVIFLTVFAGCVAHKKASTPEGFARYSNSQEFKAISPEGVVFRVRDEENKPYAELPFWKEALKKRMLDAGYIFQSEAPIAVKGEQGYLLELTAPFGEKDYTYLTAIFVRSSKIVIAEAAGEASDLAAHRDAILAAIQDMVVEQ